jgi:hypothetical protein
MSDKRQVLPLPKVQGIWESGFARYPDVVRVCMSDGKVIRYRRERGENESMLKEALDRLDRTCCFGGEKYKEKGRGKRTGKIEREESDNGHSGNDSGREREREDVFHQGIRP